MQAVCAHLDQVDPGRPAATDACAACLTIGSSWVHLRQCLTCGVTSCCDSSPHRHATRHFHESGHPMMQTLEDGQDWAWCFVDRLTLEPDDGTWRIVDPFFDTGLWFARERLAGGGSMPFPVGATAGDGFPLSVWETTYRGRHRAGTLDPDQAKELESLPGWTW